MYLFLAIDVLYLHMYSFVRNPLELWKLYCFSVFIHKRAEMNNKLEISSYHKPIRQRYNTVFVFKQWRLLALFYFFCLQVCEMFFNFGEKS